MKSVPLQQQTFSELRQTCPALFDFFVGQQLAVPGGELRLEAYLAQLSTAPAQAAALNAYVAALQSLRGDRFRLTALHISGGRDKNGQAEALDLQLVPGEVICLVGPTGSGKSRFLADIEWMAQGDTPTGRRLLVNGQPPDPAWRFSPEHKLVAQLSQNMNFVMDLSVAEFVRLHAESRLLPDAEQKVAQVIAQANALAGEGFSGETAVTALSGGQSRALMVADTALLSQSPIVLIDEIENAGIDRRRALKLLLREEKIVLMATHDPILALMGSQRLVFRQGGVAQVLQTSRAEQEQLAALEAYDQRWLNWRNRIRSGARLEQLDSETDPYSDGFQLL
ncbi:MAG: ATP-binding cassette domain-containing protein [Desulfuromonas thiophila]|jgi:ABC-type lipoprotein export system ATPase subunit|nr:ATP-binding cassette domain-containing protein [Desulfuromonas thiophila]MDD3800841.1 ATP-binding cassette domain-containing protein [Desulfuromonas thiophila]MDY0397283.1 ATP-binding cassette domain-containing protein [Desulfuromonas thiophila]